MVDDDLSEADQMRLLQQEATKLGARLFRQNSGLAWVGRLEKVAERRFAMVEPGDVILRKARPFRAGFPGWSDLGGFMPVEIKPFMVGATLPIYSQVEVKKETRPTREQREWIAFVQKVGGRAGIAHDVSELRKILLG